LHFSAFFPAAWPFHWQYRHHIHVRTNQPQTTRVKFQFPCFWIQWAA
jgi:hypothetical protein